MVEVRYSIYFLQPLPHLVHSSNFNWRRHGRGGGEVGRDVMKICMQSERYKTYFQLEC